jgi:hypothetical protein
VSEARLDADLGGGGHVLERDQARHDEAVGRSSARGGFRLQTERGLSAAETGSEFGQGLTPLLICIKILLRRAENNPRKHFVNRSPI